MPLYTRTHGFFFSDNVNFQNLKDAIAVAQLETNGIMSFQTAKLVVFYFFRRKVLQGPP